MQWISKHWCRNHEATNPSSIVWIHGLKQVRKGPWGESQCPPCICIRWCCSNWSRRWNVFSLEKGQIENLPLKLPNLRLAGSVAQRLTGGTPCWHWLKTDTDGQSLAPVDPIQVYESVPNRILSKHSTSHWLRRLLVHDDTISLERPWLPKENQWLVSLIEIWNIKIKMDHQVEKSSFSASMLNFGGWTIWCKRSMSKVFVDRCGQEASNDFSWRPFVQEAASTSGTGKEYDYPKERFKDMKRVWVKSADAANIQWILYILRFSSIARLECAKWSL